MVMNFVCVIITSLDEEEIVLRLSVCGLWYAFTENVAKMWLM